MSDGHTPKENKIDKDTNPKDVIGSSKLPISLVPASGIAYATLSFLEGALKYGRYNWRVAGVRSSIYLDAIHRHLSKYQDGEDVDLKTGVPHLSSILACVMIIVDAKIVNKLTDDRPPRAPIGSIVDIMAGDVARLKETFKDYHPHQYTIADTPVDTPAQWGTIGVNRIPKECLAKKAPTPDNWLMEKTNSLKHAQLAMKEEELADDRETARLDREEEDREEELRDYL